MFEQCSGRWVRFSQRLEFIAATVANGPVVWLAYVLFHISLVEVLIWLHAWDRAQLQPCQLPS